MPPRINKDDVLARLTGEDAVRFIQSLGHPLVKKGREWKMPCPFHDDREPSMALITHKNNSHPFFKCYPCGWGGDVLKFVEELYGLAGFPETLEFVADRLGIAKSEKQYEKKVQEKRAVVHTSGSETMTPKEVYQSYRDLMAHAVDPKVYCNGLGVAPEAVDLTGGFFASVRRNVDTGRYTGGDGGVCAIVPMRSGDKTTLGELLSLRFASMQKRQGERRKRWSLDETKPGDNTVQTKHSRSGLLAPIDYFGEAPPPDTMSILVEGETDLWAGLSMMIEEFGLDVGKWPARWFGLPGVTSCHDMLIPELVGTFTFSFMDADQAGRNAVFDRKPRICELCKRRVTHGDTCRFKPPTTGVECGGRAMVDIAQELIPGLLSKLQGQGIKAMAAFPPSREDGEKVDLRDLRREGWKWAQFEDHLLRTATKRTRDLGR